MHIILCIMIGLALPCLLVIPVLLPGALEQLSVKIDKVKKRFNKK